MIRISQDKPGKLRVLPTETYFAVIRQELEDQGRAYVRVTGQSMMPLLRHLKDGVILRPGQDARVGDIVLFDRRNGRYALHRVIRRENGRFSMAGDAQWHVEEGLPCGQILGIAESIVRGGRSISCRGLPMRMYARSAAALTYPRIALRRLAGRLLDSLRRRKGDSA